MKENEQKNSIFFDRSSKTLLIPAECDDIVKNIERQTFENMHLSGDK